MSPYEIKVETIQGVVTLDGQVPSEQIKAVAGAIVQDTSGVKELHNSIILRKTLANHGLDLQIGDALAEAFGFGVAHRRSVDDQIDSRSDAALRFLPVLLDSIWGRGQSIYVFQTRQTATRRLTRFSPNDAQ